MLPIENNISDFMLVAVVAHLKICLPHIVYFEQSSIYLQSLYSTWASTKIQELLDAHPGKGRAHNM